MHVSCPCTCAAIASIFEVIGWPSALLRCPAAPGRPEGFTACTSRRPWHATCISALVITPAHKLPNATAMLPTVQDANMVGIAPEQVECHQYLTTAVSGMQLIVADGLRNSRFQVVASRMIQQEGAHCQLGRGPSKSTVQQHPAGRTCAVVDHAVQPCLAGSGRCWLASR